MMKMIMYICIIHVHTENEIMFCLHTVASTVKALLESNAIILLQDLAF